MAREISRQVGLGLRVSFLQRGDRALIQLKPESLGKVQVDLMRTNEGITARFRVETQEAKDALGSQLPQLKNSFESRGVNLVSVQVELGDGRDPNGRTGGEQKRRGRAVNQEISGTRSSLQDSSVENVWSPWGFETRA